MFCYYPRHGANARFGKLFHHWQRSKELSWLHDEMVC